MKQKATVVWSSIPFYSIQLKQMGIFTTKDYCHKSVRKDQTGPYNNWIGFFFGFLHSLLHVVVRLYICYCAKYVLAAGSLLSMQSHSISFTEITDQQGRNEEMLFDVLSKHMKFSTACCWLSDFGRSDLFDGYKDQRQKICYYYLQ